MKYVYILFLLAVTSLNIKADSFDFQVHRFCTIHLNTDKGKESVLIEVYPKAVPKTVTILKSPLKLVDEVYKTPGGICFDLQQLAKPIINDHNRRINSGDWVLLLSGESKSYKEFLTRMPNAPNFSESFENPIYLGEKVEADKQKTTPTEPKKAKSQ